jgi:hypothetical protein
MAKFKPARGKSKTPAIAPGGLSCVILIIAGVILLMLFMYFVMKNSG